MSGWKETITLFGYGFFFFFLPAESLEYTYEYKMACGINEIQTNNGILADPNLPIICVLLAIFGVGIASLAIQQYQINKLYGSTSDD